MPLKKIVHTRVLHNFAQNGKTFRDSLHARSFLTFTMKTDWSTIS